VNTEMNRRVSKEGEEFLDQLSEYQLLLEGVNFILYRNIRQISVITSH
jgi:hypothetical protein